MSYHDPVICNRFKSIRKHLNLSQPEMSSHLGLSKNTWQSYESGLSSPGTAVYRSLSDIGFSVDWILSGIGYMLTNEVGQNRYSFLPLFDVLHAMNSNRIGVGAEIEFAGDSTPIDWLAFKKEWIESEVHVDINELALVLVVGDSMYPTFKPSDILLIDLSQKSFSGDGVYALNVNGVCSIKRIQFFISGSIRVSSDNGVYAPQEIRKGDLENIIVIGRVVWHAGKV
jgi:phage repressor protein C with HTH and peptisase S24 domain